METPKNIVKNIDWVIVLTYILLATGGIVSIYSSLYDGGGELPSRFVNQLTWFGISVVCALGILLVDSRLYYINSYPIYFIMIIIMIGVMLFGKVVNGAKSWISIGSFSVQPVEFMKLATSLALARYMSSYSFDMRRLDNFFTMGCIILLPVSIIIFQNDTGSALVYGGFLLMLYREGLNKMIYILGLSAIAIFVASFLLEPFVLVSAIIVTTLLVYAIKYGHTLLLFIYLAILFLLYFVIHFITMDETVGYLDPYVWLLVLFGLSLPLLYYFAYFVTNKNMLKYINYTVFCVALYLSVNYVFDNILQLHQRKRILDLLGIESDIFGWGYNVNQSKIAIGSGGLTGKGLFNGTQTKFNFVPEQSTDFIFCTIGEEFGFIGTAIVVILFGILILRLMEIGDKTEKPFSRIYCYCVASIFFFHILINIGMTIGIAPVIGIPLPFFSYGGSSLLAFTIMLAIALKLNMDKQEG